MTVMMVLHEGLRRITVELVRVGLVVMVALIGVLHEFLRRVVVKVGMAVLVLMIYVIGDGGAGAA